MLLSARLSATELSTRWMARALGVLYASGGTLALVWTVLPHPRETGDRVVVAMALTAVVLGLALSVGPTHRLPPWTLHTVIAVIQVVISVAYVAVGTPDNDIRLFYAWATPYAAFFFGRRAALSHSLWVGACLAVSLDLIGGSAAESLRVWLLTMGTVAAVGTLVSIVSGRLREGQRLLHDAAVRDPLTGLANRRGFSAALDEALDAQRRLGGGVVVMLVDLDHFKLVNDSYGHQVGDQVLEQIAPRLVAAVPSGDLVARMGGDEFAVVCRDLTGGLDVPELVARLQQVWKEPVPGDPGLLAVSGSIGVVRADAPGGTAESLLRDADIALYRAKAQQRGSAVVYEECLRQDIDRRATLDRGLRTALARDELSLAYQAVVDLETEEVVGAEALLRWTSPELGKVPPCDFVPVAEDRGLIGGIGAWVIDEACGVLAGWRAAGVVDDRFVLALNVSGRQLGPGFAETVSDALSRHGLPPCALHLEITESVLLDDTAHTKRALDDLCAIGSPLLLDDFGTGFSSLSYLYRLPLRGLKIDKSFVDHINRSPRHRTLVAAILSMADGLGMGVVAEGVESRDVAEVLRSLGCRRAQGYLWARPEPAAAFEQRMRRSVRVS